MTNDQYLKATLATLAWQEAHPLGGIDCMMAVALVIRNRVFAGWGSFQDVIARHHLWSATMPTLEPLVPVIDLSTPEARMLLQGIDGVLDGTAPDKLTLSAPYDPHGKKALPTPALYYAELHKIEREWFKTKIVQDRANHPIIGMVGQLTLFA